MLLRTFYSLLLFYLKFRFQSHVSPNGTYETIALAALVPFITAIFSAVLTSVMRIIL